MQIPGIKKSCFVPILAVFVFAAGVWLAKPATFYARDASTAHLQKEISEAEVAYNLGIKYYTGTGGAKRDIDRAMSWFRNAAALGLAKAQYRLGAAYEKGEGVKKDYAAALKWYHLAAEQNDRDGQNGLGDLYAAGHGVVSDHEEAAKWYRLAADQGLAKAQYALGRLYLTGQGVEESYKDAYFWLALGAKEFDSAMEKRDEAAKHLSDEQLQTIRIQVESWYPLKQKIADD